MLFTQPIWLSLLIPILFALVLLIASLVVRQWRLAWFDRAMWLSAGGLALTYVTGGPLFSAVLVGFVLFTHWMGIAIERGPSRAWLLIAIVGDVAIVAALFSPGVVTAGPLHDVHASLVPFGLSFFAFHGISYVVDVYRRRVAADRSRFQLAVHLLLLPQLVGGPLAYESVAPQLGRRWPSVSDYSYGARRLLLGVWKVFVIAQFAGTQADAAFGLNPERLNAFQAWLGLASFSVQIYYAFSGYSDMGIGLGRMLGVRLPENFRWPYVGLTVREFWLRWHIGLSGWFRQYTDFSLDPDHVPPPTLGREALVAVLCGLWYGSRWTFVVWGLYHGLLVALERTGLEARMKRLPAPVRHVYVLVLVLVGWVILRSETLGSALLFLRALAGMNPTAFHARQVVDLEVWLLLVAGAIGCAPLFNSIRRWTVAIDALIVSLLMMLFAAVLFVWRGVLVVATPILRWWRRSMTRVGRRGGRALSRP